ncbi:MAG: cytochrome c biogenesis protein ResB, partial [Aquiluna sp.]
RYASLDIAYNPGGIWVLVFAALALVSLVLSLSIQRRRVWVRVTDEKIEYAALARGDDAGLESLVLEIKSEIEERS